MFSPTSKKTIVNINFTTNVLSSIICESINGIAH